MKKRKVLLGILSIYLLTGCSNTKTLECGFIDNAGFLEKQILEYKNNKLDSYTMIYSYDFKDLNEELLENEFNMCDSIMKMIHLYHVSNK